MIRSIAALGLAATLVTPAARAALTDSEQAQVAGFVRGGEVANAARVRALVARADLSADESAAPLVAGYAAVPFDQARARFTQELLFGAGSEAARSTLAPVVVRALVARANALIDGLSAPENPAYSAAARGAAEEVVRLHAWVAENVANAGKPPPDGHDATLRIRDDAYRAAAEAYKAHLEKHGSFLKHKKPAAGAWLRARAQTQLTTVALARGVVPRHELSSWLGLDGSSRAAFERHGLLVEDAAQPADGSVAVILGWFDGAPHAARGADLLLLDKAPVAGLSARGTVLRAAANAASGVRLPPALLFAEEVEPASPDAALAEAALAVAWQATRTAFRDRPALRSLAERVAARAARAGDAGYLARALPASVLVPPGAEHLGAHGASPEQVTAHALQLVLLDAPRTVTLALSRAARGRDEPLAQLSIALGVLAAQGGEGPAQLATGRTRPDGAVELFALREPKVDGDVVVAFGLDKQRVELSIASDGRVERVTVDKKPPQLSQLPHVRLVPEAAAAWSVAGLSFEKLFGAPRGLAVDDGRFVLAAADKSGGFDSVVAGSAEQDQSVRARVTPTASGGGLLVRAQPGSDSYDAVALLVSEKPARALLVLVDGKGRAIELAPAVELPAADAKGYALSLAVKGQKVTAEAAGKKLSATLERGVGQGRVGLTARAGGRIEVRDFQSSSVKRGKP